MILMAKATTNLMTITQNIRRFVYELQTTSRIFLDNGSRVCNAYIFSRSFWWGKDSVVAKSVINHIDSVKSEAQAPDPHGKSNH